MDNNKICFIMCTNNDMYAKEAVYFLETLKIPRGFTVDVLTIKDAKSMASGYNEGMKSSDARYKVYMHQDVFIVDKYFIHKVLKIFKDETVGMIGMVGSPKLPENKVMWKGPRIGKIYCNNVYATQMWELGEVSGECDDVEAVDGLLMVTQYDVPWREDIFDGWDFYDVSQSTEFLRRGYRVVIPKMDKPWCIHDDGFMDLKNYYNQRRKFIEEYVEK